MTVTLWTRPREVLIEIIQAKAGECSACGEPVALAKFAWDHRITADLYRPGEWRLGEDAFTVLRHTDGTPNHGDATLFAKPQCGKCGAVDQIKVELLAYDDHITCTACGDSHYRSIGD